MQSTKQSSRLYLILAVLMAGAFVAVLNSTLLNIALPSIMVSLDIQTSTAQWLTTGYMLVNGIMIPTSAFLVQKFSTRQLFLTAMGLFTIGTIVAGQTELFPVLLSARMLQASGSAIMMPLLMNVLITGFPIEKRGQAMGIFGLVITFAPAIGPTLSGWVLEHYEWPMLFHIVTPIAVLVLVLGFFLLKKEVVTSSLRIDRLSLVLSSFGFGGLLYGFSSAGSAGWGSFSVIGALAVGFISLVSFIIRQLRLETPMLEFRIFKYPMFALSQGISMVLNMSMFSAMILMPIYVQTIRGISPFHSGLLMLPGALVMAFMSPITGRLFDRFGARVLAIIGLSLTVLTTFFFSRLTADTAYSFLVIMYTLRFLGISMVMMPVMTNGLNHIPQHLTPHGTALNNTLSQVSGAIGSGILISVMTSRTASYATDLTANATATATPKTIMTQAMVEGINDTFFIATLLALFALILSFFIKKRPAETLTVVEPVAEKKYA
ncbi:DHA2 family efflux MFS transporter permease subunit [Exiguobacterium sp. s193]|uniref:DHA2 family efflux MFS transporter permease subunit n=1 Tax=Exiguobacterium sp. s193 TaxID=2751207 RepID=UPI001BEB8680|nr:DHA2 family efflux MFS transporter permease subunit [Exiguobacterium sp. s193]